MKYHLYYFSATGNTGRGVRIIEEELIGLGHAVSVVRINRETAPLPDRPDRLVIAFPTFSWIPPVLVQRFIRRLPHGRGLDGARLRAAVFTADGGGCLQAPNQLRRMLQRRGYEVFLTGRATFPDNWQQFIPGPDEETKTKLILKGEEMTREFARDLLNEKESYFLVALGHQLWSRIVGSLFSFFGRRFMGKMYIADSDCTSCGLCKKTCPVGAILLSDRRNAKPYWKANCESCNRCINVCPEKAIVCSYARTVVLILAIIGSVMAVLALYSDHLVPLLAEAVPSSLFGVVNVLITTALVIAAHFLVIGPFDRFVLRWLQKIPGIKTLFSFGYNKSSRRYLMTGFNPPIEKV